MGKKALVSADVEDGERFYRAVQAAGFHVVAAAWLRLSEEPEFKLYLAMPEIETIGPFKIYTRIRELLEEGDYTDLTFDDVVVANARNHFVMTLARAFNVDNSVIHIAHCTVDDLHIDEMILYRMNLSPPTSPADVAAMKAAEERRARKLQRAAKRHAREPV